MCAYLHYKAGRSLEIIMNQAFRGEVYDTATALLLARHTPPSGIEALRG